MPTPPLDFGAQAWMDDLRRRDPELAAEADAMLALGSAREAESVPESGPRTASDSLPSPAALPPIGGSRSPMGRVRDSSGRVPEAIVRAGTRPVFQIRNNRFLPETIGPDSRTWAKRLELARARVDAAIPAVGRIEFDNHPRQVAWGGTAWLIRPRILVTNRHVATIFALRDGKDVVFRTGLDPDRGLGCNVDFLEEHLNDQSLAIPVIRVLWIAPRGEPDMAFLLLDELASGSLAVAPIGIAPDPPDEDHFVATIGYPAFDPDSPDVERVREAFGDVYDKKRLSPGQVMPPEGNDLRHDCSTLRGNSGSVVLSLDNGNAVGLHYEGEYMKANYAIPINAVKQALDSVVGSSTPESLDRVVTPVPEAAHGAVAGGGFANIAVGNFVVPIEIRVTIGQPQLVGGGQSAGPASGTSPDAAGQAVLERALAAAQTRFSTRPGVLGVRIGKRMQHQWVTNEDVIVVTVAEKLGPTRLDDRSVEPLPTTIEGVGVDVRTASILDQLRAQGVDFAEREAEAPPGINYVEPPHLSLKTVDEPMSATFHLSPDCGFPVLREFLRSVTSTLTATMYEWDAQHVFDEVLAAVQPAGRKLLMVTQPPQSDDSLEEFVELLKEELGNRFQHVTAAVLAPANLFDTAYHIKVAVADSRRVWLSSGNWKESGQPDIDPAGDGETSWRPLERFNREWHVVIDNAALAKQFEDYIRYDFEQSSAARESEAAPAPPQLLPDIFVPASLAIRTPEAPTGPATYFPPLVKNGRLRVTPLLTPDFTLYIDAVLKLIRSARRSILVENQAFNYSGVTNKEKFEEFFDVLLDKQARGLDARIIFRDTSEFGGDSPEKLEELITRLHTIGFEPNSMRIQMNCHTKGIIVDSSRVLLGSHNLTNAGTHTNRDASLIVDDADVARYFEGAFELDWANLADQRIPESAPGVRVARSGEETPTGMIRIPASAVLDSDFPQPSFFESLQKRMDRR